MEELFQALLSAVREMDAPFPPGQSKDIPVAIGENGALITIPLGESQEEYDERIQPIIVERETKIRTALDAYIGAYLDARIQDWSERQIAEIMRRITRSAQQS